MILDIRLDFCVLGDSLELGSFGNRRRLRLGDVPAWGWMIRVSKPVPTRHKNVNNQVLGTRARTTTA